MNTYERQRWIEERRKGVGASEAAAVVGTSPWATALEVYARKTGQLDEKQPTEPMRWGLRLEEAISAAYEEETGTSVGNAPDIMQHEQYPFMLASLDRLTISRTPPKVVELKNVGPWARDGWGDPGTDQVPEHYCLQVQQQMAVADLDSADIAALFGGNDFKIFTVSRNERLINFLVEKEAEFWDMVLSKRPPDPDWAHRSTPDLIRAMYAVNEEAIARFGAEQQSLADRYDHLGVEEKAAKDERERVKCELLHAMGEAALAYLPDGSTLTRKQVHAEVKAHVRDYVMFNHRQPRKGKAS